MRNHKRKLYHVPFKSPLVLTVENCSQSTCTQSPTRSCTSLHINNANTPKLHLNQKNKTYKQRGQQYRSPTYAKTTEHSQTSDVKHPKTPNKGCEGFSPFPTTPKTPTVHPLNAVNTQPCTTPNRHERRPEVQKYLEKHLPRTPKAKSRKGVISKKNKSGTPSHLMKISALNQPRTPLNGDPILRYHQLTKSSVAYSTSQKTNVSAEKSRMYEFQSSPQRASNGIERKDAHLQNPVKQSVLQNIRKVAHELKELRERLNCLQAEGLVQNNTGYPTKSYKINNNSASHRVLCPEA